MIYAYPPEVERDARAWCNGVSNKELAERINAAHGTEFTDQKMKCFLNNHGISREKRAKNWPYSEVFPEEINKYIHANYLGCGPTGMVKKLKEEFGRDYTVAQVKGFYHNHKLNSGTDGRFEKGHINNNSPAKGTHLSVKTEFKKGNRPYNWHPVGSENITVDGFRIRKIAEPHEWEFVHRIVWEEAHGPIAKGNVIIFLDGDKMNCNLDNLAMVTRQEHLILNRSGLRMENPEATKTAVMMAKVKAKVFERKKNDK